MKKIFIVFITLLLWSSVAISAGAGEVLSSIRPIDATGQRTEDTGVLVVAGICNALNGDRISLEMSDNSGWKWFQNVDEETQELLLSNAGEKDYIVMFGLVSDDEENLYTEIQPLEIQIETNSPVGHWRSTLLGRDYRLYYVENNTLEEIVIEEYDDKMVTATVDRLSTYVLYYNPGVYSVTFYDDALEFDEEFEIVNEEYYRIDNLRKYDTFEFPEIPQREGYVFTGWKHEHSQGAYYMYEYVKPQEYSLAEWGDWRVRAFDVREIYASWCPEEEYTPLEVTIESEKKITKGKEDGVEIILILSEGKFAETIDYDIEADWKIVGEDEITIGSVERIDDSTAKITLSGNSGNKYTKGEIQIEFNSKLYESSERDEYEGIIYEVADIQLDENGIKKAMFISDNSITLEKQRRSSGGSGGTSSYTVKFNTNGGEEIESKMVGRNTVVAEPEMPVREGYVFEGWYTDAELTKSYDFEAKVTGSFTLYAAWKEDESKKIVLTVGEKKAVVFGNEVTNDVSPVIRNDRVMLPVRFVAESLGAEVLWSAENPYEVKITKGDTEIVIYIGEEEALVNGEKVTLDSPAFLENDRTYLPIRFVSENLGCKVEWVQNTQEVVITK